MKLKALVQQTNATYDLKISEARVPQLVNTMRSAGFSQEVEGRRLSEAVDFIIAHVKKPVTIGASYSSLKNDIVADAGMVCPIDHRNAMATIKLVRDREALYCKACNVTLPLKVK